MLDGDNAREGTSDVPPSSDARDHREFMKELLRDLQVLERMLLDDCIEAGVSRIGAEQELFLVNRDWLPATNNMALLEEIADPHFTPELGRFNLEVNLDPLHSEGACLSTMEEQLTEMLKTQILM